MKHSRFILALLLIITTLVSCGGSSDGGGDDTQREEEPTTGGTAGGTTGGTTGGGSGRPARLVYDSELTPRERVGLDGGTATLGRLDINGNVIPKFSQVFGGSRSANVVNYFETRVNYAFSESTDLDSRLVSNILFAQIIAVNPSSVYWFLSLLNEENGQNLQIRVNDRLVDINSSRIGLMKFGAPFAQLTSIEQAIVIVHEGRHSDCTGGVTVADVNRSLAGQDMEDPRCGHAHRICPPGHPDAGVYACDEHAWGAYAISAIYAFAISESCTNCSQVDKTLAEAIGQLSVRRLQYSYSDLLNGAYGSPNMSSSTQVR